MDLLADVRKTSKRLAQAETRYLDAMRARNLAIREARLRVGPGAIAQESDLTPEQVRRICNAATPDVGYPTKAARTA